MKVTRNGSLAKCAEVLGNADARIASLDKDCHHVGQAEEGPPPSTPEPAAAAPARYKPYTAQHLTPETR
jgi:hypothetical protein